MATLITDLIFMDPCIVVRLSSNNQQDATWYGIYYSTVHYKLNMFRTVCRSSSGAPTVFAASGLNTQVVTARSQV